MLDSLRADGRAVQTPGGGWLHRDVIQKTATDILAAIQSSAHAQGKRLNGSNLVLTSALSSKTITIQNAQLKNGGFMFGGGAGGLGTGEVGWVAQMGFNTDTSPSGSAGQPDPLIIFSA